MRKSLNFEKIHDAFIRLARTSPISHCDRVDFAKDVIQLVEETMYIDPKLLQESVFQKELIDLVKKMWGSFAIFLWCAEKSNRLSWLRKPRDFVVEIQVLDSSLSKIVPRLRKDLERYKNGAYRSIRFRVK